MRFRIPMVKQWLSIIGIIVAGFVSQACALEPVRGVWTAKGDPDTQVVFTSSNIVVVGQGTREVWRIMEGTDVVGGLTVGRGDEVQHAVCSLKFNEMVFRIGVRSWQLRQGDQATILPGVNAPMLTGEDVGKTATAATAAQPPLSPDDKFAEAWFGVWRSEPIWTGWVFVDGHYMDAPYVVEGRGVAVYVNGTLCKRSFPEDRLFPNPQHEPLYEDPGVPQDVTEATPFPTARFHPVTLAKFRYWRTLHLPIEEYVRRWVEYWTALPCISKVERFYDERSNNLYVVVYDRDGKPYRTDFGPRTGFVGLLTQPDPKKLMADVTHEQQGVVAVLGGGYLMEIVGGPHIGFGPSFQHLSHGLQRAQILASGRSPDEMAKELLKLHYGTGDPQWYRTQDGLLFTDFRATPQFWQRMTNEAAWRAEAERTYQPLPSGVIKAPNLGTPLTNRDK